MTSIGIIHCLVNSARLHNDDEFKQLEDFDYNDLLGSGIMWMRKKLETKIVWIRINRTSKIYGAPGDGHEICTAKVIE